MGQQLKPVASCKDVGILLDSGLTFNEHVASLTSSLMSSLCQINRVKHLFPKNVLLLVINALIFSKLFYCSTVWSGTSKQNINKLQLAQNFAARILKPGFHIIAGIAEKLAQRSQRLYGNQTSAI